MATTLPDQIERYLTKHPRRVIPVSTIFDDLGLFTINTSTGHKSYVPGNEPMRRLLYGKPASVKFPNGIPPLEGLDLVTSVESNRGGKGGKEWSKCSVRYTPPAVPKAEPAPVTAPTPVEAESVEPETWTLAPAADLSKVETELASIHAAIVCTNSLLGRLLAAWGEANPSPSEADLKQWAEDDEQKDPA